MWKRWFGPQPEPEIAHSDEALLPALSDGDEAAFLTIYRRRQAALFRYAAHLTGDEDVAAEVVQETFLALIRDAKKLDASRGTVLSWLFAVARNQVLKQMASRRRHLSLEEEDRPEPAAAGCLETEFEQEQAAARVREMLATLPPAYREVLVLCDMQELSYEEVAAIAGCPLGTVRSRLHRARMMLAGKLKPLVGSAR